MRVADILLKSDGLGVTAGMAVLALELLPDDKTVALAGGLGSGSGSLRWSSDPGTVDAGFGKKRSPGKHSDPAERLRRLAGCR